MDQALQKYNWEPSEDVVLVNTCLEYIVLGKPIRDAYKKAAELMGGRTAKACDNRWNVALKKRVRSKVERAKTIKEQIREAHKRGEDLAVPVDLDFVYIDASTLKEPDHPEPPKPTAPDAETPAETINPLPEETDTKTEPRSEESAVPISQDTQDEQTLYTRMIQAIDDVLNHGVTQHDQFIQMQKELAAAKQEAAMLWDRVAELEEIERKYKKILEVMG